MSCAAAHLHHRLLFTLRWEQLPVSANLEKAYSAQIPHLHFTENQAIQNTDNSPFMLTLVFPSCKHPLNLYSHHFCYNAVPQAIKRTILSFLTANISVERYYCIVSLTLILMHRSLILLGTELLLCLLTCCDVCGRWRCSAISRIRLQSRGYSTKQT